MTTQTFSTNVSDWIGMNVGTDLMNIFVGASIQDVSIEDYADDHSYILYVNLTLYVNQAFNTKVCYFPINKYDIYHIDIPKTGNEAMAIACYCSSIITSGEGFSSIRDINSQEIGEGTDGQYSFDYEASDNGYLAIVYNTSAAIPVCTLIKSTLSERVSKLENENLSVDFNFNDVYDVTNYGLFVDIIAEKKYNKNGVLINDSNYNATSITYLDKHHDIDICNITTDNRIVFFDKEMNFINYIDGGYAYNVISKNNFPQNAMYVAFSYPTNTDTGALFSTRQERVIWLDNNLTVKSSVRKIRGSRPKLFIYVNDTEAEILFKLVDAYLTKDCDVYWEPGTYTFSDIFIDMADEYGIGLAGGAWARELPIGGNCRYFFNNSIIIGNFPSSLTDAKVFGTMWSNIGNYELHDVTIISNDMVYCVHDEGNEADGTYIHGYYNCKMVSNKTSKAVRCIGGGTGKHGVAIIDNCVFEGVDNVTDVAYHGITNSAVTDICDFVVNIKNSYFKYGAQVNTLSTNQTGRLVYCGNSAIIAPNVFDGWTSNEWNNELRS